jgi:hypothetical protein
MLSFVFLRPSLVYAVTAVLIYKEMKAVTNVLISTEVITVGADMTLVLY